MTDKLDLLVAVTNLAAERDYLEGYLEAVELPGARNVGDTLGRRLLDAAPFASAAELLGVRGIGPKTAENNPIVLSRTRYPKP